MMRFVPYQTGDVSPAILTFFLIFISSAEAAIKAAIGTDESRCAILQTDLEVKHELFTKNCPTFDAAQNPSSSNLHKAPPGDDFVKQKYSWITPALLYTVKIFQKVFADIFILRPLLGF
jgi:hypothetical protein